jgi:glycosyltransferase involved in cell wall biosynthesis
MKPRVSFVIPVYNGEAYLRETLDSCLDQSIKQLEVVVVNDASTDGTSELLDFYQKKDLRIRPINLKVNGGSAVARNVGNKAALGEYILVLDGDDKATRNRAKDTIECFKLKKADLVYGGFITIDTFGNMERRFAPEPFTREKSLKFKTHQICHSTVAYRQGLTLNVQYVEEHAKLAMEDFSFIWKAHTKGYKFAYVKAPLCYYRITDGSQSRGRNEAEVKRVKNEFVESLKI